VTCSTLPAPSSISKSEHRFSPRAAVPRRTRKEKTDWPSRGRCGPADRAVLGAEHTLEYQKKLFWCFFGPILFADEIAKERLDGVTELANRLHTERLSALYVGYSGDELNNPSETISAEYCATVIDAAASQVAVAQAEVPRIPYRRGTPDATMVPGNKCRRRREIRPEC
jgi:hypothetical protein